MARGRKKKENLEESTILQKNTDALQTEIQETKKKKPGRKKKVTYTVDLEQDDDYDDDDIKPFKLEEPEEELEDPDEINDEEILTAQGLDQDFENELESEEELDDADNKTYSRVYKASSKSEQIRQKFIGICEKYNSGDPVLKLSLIHI